MIAILNLRRLWRFLRPKKPRPRVEPMELHDAERLGVYVALEPEPAFSNYHRVPFGGPLVGVDAAGQYHANARVLEFGQNNDDCPYHVDSWSFRDAHGRTLMVGKMEPPMDIPPNYSAQFEVGACRIYGYFRL